MPGTGLDFDLLRSFVAVVDSGGFTRAAERLRVSQSTMSLHIRRLEEALGRSVLDRGPQLAPTAAGEVLLGYARQILRLVDEAGMALKEGEVEGRVRLGTPEDFATSHLPSVLAAFARSHPRVALDVRCDFTLTLLDGFGRGEFDLVLVKREPQGPGGGVPVWREPLVWVGVGDSLLPRDQVVPLVAAPPPDVYRSRAVAALEGVGRGWRVVYTSPSLAGIQAAVRAGLGVTILPRGLVPEDFTVLGRSHGLPPLPDAEIALLRAPALAPAAERLAEHLMRSLNS
ncbi:MAG: LysR family transcriptional regulator [Alphaproteobacteria bacterium]|nr:LysR substrate-binding domain-containing protein [Alphaproteobacteria bacterium]TAD90430.1 MAG: LysR family transcriptional regulator [Alphaproteobacteria bacterium]